MNPGRNGKEVEQDTVAVLSSLKYSLVPEFSQFLVAERQPPVTVGCHAKPRRFKNREGMPSVQQSQHKAALLTKAVNLRQSMG